MEIFGVLTGNIVVQDYVRFISCHIQSSIMNIEFFSCECIQFTHPCCLPEYQCTTELIIPSKLWHTMFDQSFCCIWSWINWHLVRRILNKLPSVNLMSSLLVPTWLTSEFDKNSLKLSSDESSGVKIALTVFLPWLFFLINFAIITTYIVSMKWNLLFRRLSPHLLTEIWWRSYFILPLNIHFIV